MVHHLSSFIIVMISLAYFAFSFQTIMQVHAIKPSGNAKFVAACLVTKCLAMSALFLCSLLPDSANVQTARAALGFAVAACLWILVIVNYPRIVAALLDTK